MMLLILKHFAPKLFKTMSHFSPDPPTFLIFRLVSHHQISLQSNSCISKTSFNRIKMWLEEKQLFYGVTFFFL